MRKIMAGLAVGAVAWLGLAGAAHAQNMAAMQSAATARPLSFGIGGGVVVPRTGASAHTLRQGAHGQAFVLLRLPGGLPALRATLDYATMKCEGPSLPGAGGVETAGTAERTMLDGVASMSVNLLRGPVRPYILAGVGAFSVKDEVNGTSYSNVNFGLDGGAGIAIQLGPISGFVEARFQNVYTKTEGLVDTKSIQSIPITFGLVF